MPFAMTVQAEERQVREEIMLAAVILSHIRTGASSGAYQTHHGARTRKQPLRYVDNGDCCASDWSELSRVSVTASENLRRGFLIVRIT